jgi:hypothetical protein
MFKRGYSIPGTGPFSIRGPIFIRPLLGVGSNADKALFQKKVQNEDLLI